jgi:hypothetical protein
MAHLTKFDILNTNQHGFRKNMCSENAAFTLLNEVLTALNRKVKVKGIFCDTEKAFDCVNHDILIHKMELYGVTGTNKNLYTEYLKKTPASDYERYPDSKLCANKLVQNPKRGTSRLNSGTFVVPDIY